ncbi:cob(I)yrinic acid a,c-diamide adenosyltransferase [soil metagenome]
MTSVSTKTGDKGQSGLANGQRLSKDALIFEVLGTQDELNAWIGYSLVKLSDEFTDQKKFLSEVQDTLFYIGAELAQSPKAKLSQAKLDMLEKTSEDLQSQMEKNWMAKFLFPGGHEGAARVDITRTVCRRLERLVVKYSSETEVSSIVMKYVNRLSDYLYVLRCFVNFKEGFAERPFEVTTAEASTADA